MFDVGTLAYHLRRGGVALRSRFGIRVILIHLAIIALFGVWWPHMRGVEFFDPVFLSAYACLGVVFAGPAAAQGLADRPKSMREALVKVGLAAFYGELMAILILFAGFCTVISAQKVSIGLDVIGLIWAGLLGLSGTIAVSAVAGWIAMRFSPNAARTAMRVIFLGLLCLFFFKSRWLPDVVGRGISVCTGIAILAIFAINRAIPRD
jgi:hypothetical protein